MCDSGATIADGYVTPALLPPLMADLITIRDASARINNGLNEVRLQRWCLSGPESVARPTLVSVDEVPGGPQIVIRATIGRVGGD
ncbi:hypothetical protein ACQP1G_34365 [Nocardia sp. CA-107356]|uniref:hypothetical protein n=1 Tax=Nocardia sp. CA-107356 TaxID=3239972 RepID=UPI003D8A2038